MKCHKYRQDALKNANCSFHVLSCKCRKLHFRLLFLRFIRQKESYSFHNEALKQLRIVFAFLTYIQMFQRKKTCGFGFGSGRAGPRNP